MLHLYEHSMHERTDNLPAPPLTEILLTLPQAMAVNYFLSHCRNVAQSLYFAALALLFDLRIDCYRHRKPLR